MVIFQFVFAAITINLAGGALLGRMNFLAWVFFVPLWCAHCSPFVARRLTRTACRITFSYTIGAFSIWAGGFLFQRGVIDYSGGYVIHVSSGTAGWVAAAVVGPRLDKDRIDHRPHSILFVLIGACILWIGWFGFNGGTLPRFQRRRGRS